MISCHDYAMLIGNMQALDLMKTRVVTIAPDANIGEAVDLMDIYQVSTLPVVDSEGRLVGILTDDDLLKMFCKLVGEVEYTDTDWRRNIGKRSVSESMRVPLTTVNQDTDAGELSRLMVQHQTKYLPVITVDGRFAGLVSCVDIIQAAFEASSTSDALQS